jgi:hypothetical protein
MRKCSQAGGFPLFSDSAGGCRIRPPSCHYGTRKTVTDTGSSNARNAFQIVIMLHSNVNMRDRALSSVTTSTKNLCGTSLIRGDQQNRDKFLKQYFTG